MSDAIYPTIPGLSWPVLKAPRFNNSVQVAADLSELRALFASTPVYDFTLKYDLLRDDVSNAELASLGGFFMARFGTWDSFLFMDPDDSVATTQLFGTGDGVTTDFQLVRSFGTWSEATKNIGTANIYKDAVLQSANYTLHANGVVAFSVAPTAAVALTWDGTYYYRCRFKQDVQEFRKFMDQLWDAGVVEFVGSLGSKI